MNEKDRKGEQFAQESSGPTKLKALRQRIIELEAASQEQALRFDQSQQEIARHTAELEGVKGKLQQETVERKRAEEDAQRRALQANLIYEVGQHVSSKLKLSELFSAIVTAIFDAFGYYNVLLAPVDEEAECLTLGAIAGGLADTIPKDRPVAIGEGMTGYAAATGETQLSGDVSQDPHFRRLADEETKSELAVPIKSGEKTIGILDLQSEEFDAFDQYDVLVMETLVDQVAVAMENARLYDQAQTEIADRKRAEEDAQRRALQTSLIYEVGQRVSSKLERDELFSAVVNAIFDTFGYYNVSIGPVDEEARCMTYGAVAGGFADIFPEDLKVPFGEGMSGYAAATGETQLSGDVSQDPHFYRFKDEKTQSELSVPIKSGEKVIGVLDLQSEELDAFDQTDVLVMETLADQIAVAMENARLYEQSQIEIAERERVELELRKHQERLEDRVEERTIELKTSEERYRSLFDGIPVSLYRTNPEGHFLDANPALVEMYAYPNREKLLKTKINNIYLNPDERVRWQKLMESQGVVRDFEICLKRYDGMTIWVNDTARAVKDTQGQVLYYEGSQEDITERKQAQEKLLEYQEHLEELVDERTAELQASEERYRTLFDGVPIGLYRSSPTGQILDSNLAMVNLLRFPAKDVFLQTPATDMYVDPHDRSRWKALMEKEGIIRDFEVKMRRYDGEIVWVSNTARQVKDDQDNILYYEGSLKNITERKKFEEEISRQKDYYETLFVNSPVAVVTADLDANVVSWNPSAEKLFGYKQDEAVGMNVDDLIANDLSIIEEAHSYNEQVIKLNRIQATTRRTRKDGSLVDVELLAIPLLQAGDTTGFYAMYHDISELKRVERELRQQKDYFESLFINNPVAVLTADLQGNVVSWNPMAEKMFGYSQEEAIGKHIDDLVATDPRIKREATGYTKELFSSDRLHVISRRNRKDGSMVDVEILALPSIIAGEKVGYIAIYYDITELVQARREAETANQAKSIFLANMSHELRTPLNAILGFTQLMDGDPNLTPGQQENLEIINQSGEHLLALINDVLEMSKIEAGQVKLRKDTFDLNYLLDSLEEMFRFQAEKKGLDLSFQLAESVPHYVIGDENKLRQVLNNLIGNAIKFTIQGGIKLVVSSLATGPQESTLHFDLHDTGPGIAPENIETVFDPFVQAMDTPDHMSTQAPEGTGLGLSISRQFVRLMGGDINVRSKLGSGSQFSFSVTVESAEADEVKTAQPKREVLRLAPGQPVYRLLVVEDKETNRRLLVKLLEQIGFEVQEAANGQEAIDAWQHWDPHLIWMDMRMPILNGREATRRIKSMPGGQSVKIISLTATAFDEEREQILQDGCDDFVRKPFRKNEIFEMLVKHLGVRFIYNEEPIPTTDAEKPGDAIPSKDILALAALPPDWIEELRQATRRADQYRILERINKIREQTPDLATRLTDLTERYEYQKILSLIEEAGGQR
jgi:PAS domain S-box-containing protein